MKLCYLKAVGLIHLDGCAVRYREDGESRAGAPPWLLLHMAGGSGAAWGPVASLLGRTHHVLTPDFPGHGASHGVPPEGPARPGVSSHVSGLAQWTLRLMDALKLPQAVLVGHSMGGCVALAAALAHPTRVLGLGLVATAARLQLPAGFLAFLQSDYTSFAAQFVGAALPAGAAARPIFPAAEPQVVLADFASVDGFNVLTALGDLHLPAAVVGGEMDVLTPPALLQELAQGIPQGVLTLLPGCGHLVPRENPKAVVAALAELAVRVHAKLARSAQSMG